MSDNDETVDQTNQARIYMRTSAANGLNGNEAEVTVEGGEGEDVEDIADVAEERFEQAVEAADVEDGTPREIQ